jgi:hypothetical protein
MPLGWVAAIGAGVSAISGAGNTRRAKNSQRRANNRARKSGANWRDLVNQGAPRIEARLQEKRDYLEGGFNKSQGMVSGIADSARRTTMERETQTLGKIQGSMGQRGIRNSSMMDQARRAVRFDTERSLMDIDTQLAGLRSDIEQRRTGAVAGVIGEQANFERQRTQDLADVERSFMGFEGNRTFAAPQAMDLSGLASLVGAFKPSKASTPTAAEG